MTAVLTDPSALDTSSAEPIPFARLVRVELRRMADTRAGLWLLISIGLLTALVMVIMTWVLLAQDLTPTFRDFMIGMNTPMGVLLPVLGILGVTQEWSQRTALVSFTLVPSRMRLFSAKFVALLVWAAAALVVGVLLAVAANAVFGALGGDAAVWDMSAGDLALFFLLHVVGLATGFAFGALLLNSAGAIVVYFVYSFVLPGLFEVGANLIEWFAKIRPWVDFNAAQSPLTTGSVSGREWEHLAVSGLLWLAVPLVLGLRRVLRSEVK